MMHRVLGPQQAHFMGNPLFSIIKEIGNQYGGGEAPLCRRDRPTDSRLGNDVVKRITGRHQRRFHND